MSNKEGGVQVFRRFGGRVEVGVEVLILIPKKTMTLVNFRGGGGSGSPDPPPLYRFIIQKSRESVETIDALQIYGCSIRVDISNSVNVMLWRKFKYIKGQ